MKKKIKKYLPNLLYRKTRDGSKWSNFKEKCSNYENTLTIIKLENKKIIGNFTTLPWSGQKNKYDIESFLFNQYEKFPKTRKEIDSIHPVYGYGWWTYYFGFREDMNILMNSGGSIGEAYKNGDSIIRDMKYGDTFKVEEVETFQIFQE